jgi:hypothetical protein
MKGINAMSVVMIVTLIALSIFAWISTERNVGSGQTETFQQETKLLETDRRLDKALLYIQSAFAMSAQRGSFNAANYSGRRGNSSNKRYWMCKGEPQPTTKEAARYAASNFTSNFTSNRISEIRGPEENWIYDIGEVACTETGYKKPLNSPENDNYRSAVKIHNISVTEANQEVFRNEKNPVIREQVNYNRYWYMYDRLKKWVENEDPSGHVREKLSEINSKYSKNQEQCLTNETDSPTIQTLCNGASYDDYGPNGQFPKPHVCKSISSEASSKALEGMQSALREMEQEYFDGEVSCSFGANEKKETGEPYPGVKVVPKKENKIERISGSSCGIEEEDVEGTKHKCITSWIHEFTAYMDGTIRCTDNKFKNIPRKASLENQEWRIDISFKATSEGARNLRDPCPTGGGNKPPLSFRKCSIGSAATSSCSTETSLNGEVDE